MHLPVETLAPWEESFGRDWMIELPTFARQTLRQKLGFCYVEHAGHQGLYERMSGLVRCRGLLRTPAPETTNAPEVSDLFNLVDFPLPKFKIWFW